MLLITFAGCNRQTYNIFNGEFRHVSYANNIELLTGEAIDIDAIGIWRTWIADTILLVHPPRNEEAFVSIYSLNSHKLLYHNLLLTGRGPNEYLEADMCHLYTDSFGIKAWISVNYREKLICVNITASIIQQQLVVEREIVLELEDKFAIHSAFFDADTSIVLQSIFNNDHISIYNPVSGKTRFVGWLYSQNYHNYIDVSDLSVLYVYNRQKSILAGGMAYFNQINFFPIKEGTSFSVSTTRKPIRYDNIKDIPSNLRLNYYGSVCYNEDMLIFTSKGNGSGKKSSESLTAENNFLHIVNWDGELLKIYEIDCCLVGHSFDKRTGYLYGINVETDRILRYKIF